MDDLKSVKIYDLVEELRNRGLRVDHPLYNHSLINSYPKLCKLLIELYFDKEVTENALDRLSSGIPAKFLEEVEKHLMIQEG